MRLFFGERGGHLVVDHRIRHREVQGSIPTLAYRTCCVLEQDTFTPQSTVQANTHEALVPSRPN